MNQKKLSLKSNMIWNTSGSIFYLGCQWLLTVLVVWIGGFGNAGNLSLAMAVCNTFYSIATYGMRNFQVSDVSNRFSNGTYIYSRIITGALAFFLCIIFMAVNSYSEEQRLCIGFYMFFKLSEAAFDVYAGIYQKAWRMDYIGKSMLIRGVLSLGSFTAILWITQHLVFAIAGMSVITFISVIFYDIRISRHLTNTQLDLNMICVKELLLECLPLVIYVFLSSAIGSIPRYFIERYLGKDLLGVYGSVATPTLIVQMASTYIFNPLVTVFAERYQQKDAKGFWIVFIKCIKAVAVVSVVAVLGAGFCGRWGLSLLYPANQEILNYVYLLIPLVICTILTGLSWFLGGLLTVVREFKGLIISNLAAVVISGAASYVLVQKQQLQGANIGLIAALLVEIALLVFFLLKRVRHEFSNQV